MQLINDVLYEYLYRGVLVYLDDILNYTTTMEEHARLVSQVLKKLLASQLYVKLSKCEFHHPSGLSGLPHIQHWIPIKLKCWKPCWNGAKNA